MNKPLHITAIETMAKVDYRKTTTCSQCRIWPNTLDADGVCSHCRISPRGDRVKGVWETVTTALGSIFKDHEAVIPPSVMTD